MLLLCVRDVLLFFTGLEVVVRIQTEDPRGGSREEDPSAAEKNLLQIWQLKVSRERDL